LAVPVGEGIRGFYPFGRRILSESRPIGVRHPQLGKAICASLTPAQVEMNKSQAIVQS
jgi:hypothetical protein